MATGESVFTSQTLSVRGMYAGGGGDSGLFLFNARKQDGKGVTYLIACLNNVS